MSGMYVLLLYSNILFHIVLSIFREYEGFSLSHDDAEKEYEQLKRDLRGERLSTEGFYSVGYNSPFTPVNRRNEIWIEADYF